MWAAAVLCHAACAPLCSLTLWCVLHTCQPSLLAVPAGVFKSEDSIYIGVADSIVCQQGPGRHQLHFPVLQGVHPHMPNLQHIYLCHEERLDREHVTLPALWVQVFEVLVK